jgi:glutamate--cysteine ligase
VVRPTSRGTAATAAHDGPGRPEGRGPSGKAAGPLSERDAEAFVASTCFKTGPPGQVGVELEWFCHDERDPAAAVPASRLASALGPQLCGQRPLPALGSLTCEPGGQLEISSRPAPTLASCLSATRRDVAAVASVLSSRGLCLAGVGLDPLRPPVRVLDLPRYAAMEAYFDRSGTDGRVMMCSTASVQVSLDAGDDGPGTSGVAARWARVHALAPVLAATFANSPLASGRPTGWRSTRQAVWARLDPGRTRAVPDTAPGSDPAADPRDVWARYALDAGVMCVRTAEGPWHRPVGLTFRDWLRTRRPRPPTAEDLAYHLTTLFPPVRPQGWLELRMIDAQEGDDWVVPVAVVTALVEDARAADAAAEAVEPVATPPRGGSAPAGSALLRAARDGLAAPALADAARRCFEAARDALPRLGAGPDVRAAVDAYAARYVEQGRTPADDRLDAWEAGERAPALAAR